MHHHRIRVRPERKNVPSALATLDPRTPKQCKVGCQLSRNGDRFRGAKKSFHSCLRTVYQSRQHCKGGAGWSQPWSDSSKCRGDVFFARDGKRFHSDHAGICIRAKDTCALEAWPAHHFVSKCRASHHQTHAEECRYRAQSSRRHIASCVSVSVCVCSSQWHHTSRLPSWTSFPDWHPRASRQQRSMRLCLASAVARDCRRQH